MPNILDLDYFEKNIKNVMKFGCGGNSGKFDIDIDLNCFRCFPLRSKRGISLLEVDDIGDIRFFLRREEIID